MPTLRIALVAAALVAASCSSSRNSTPPPPTPATPAPPTPAPRPPDPGPPTRSCSIPECFRAVECCAGGCDGPRVYSSCCPCRADEVDAITCPSHHCAR